MSFSPQILRRQKLGENSLALRVMLLKHLPKSGIPEYIKIHQYSNKSDILASTLAELHSHGTLGNEGFQKISWNNNGK